MRQVMVIGCLVFILCSTVFGRVTKVMAEQEAIAWFKRQMTLLRDGRGKSLAEYIPQDVAGSMGIFARLRLEPNRYYWYSKDKEAQVLIASATAGERSYTVRLVITPKGEWTVPYCEYREIKTREASRSFDYWVREAPDLAGRHALVSLAHQLKADSAVFASEAQQPNPQDLTEYAWNLLVANGQRKGPMPPRYQVNAYYTNEAHTEFVLEELLPRHAPPSQGGNRMYMRSDPFYYKDGSWHVRISRSGPDRDNVSRKVNDYLGHIIDFWSAPTAFPPLSDEQRTRQRYQLLFAAAGREPWRLKPNPTLKFVKGPNNKGEVLMRDEPRTKKAFGEIVERYQIIQPDYLGLTKVTETHEVLWILWGDTMDLFLFENRSGRLHVTDWCTQVDTSRWHAQARDRVCTVPVTQPSARATGGVGTPLALSEIDSTFGQLLLRFFRLAALNNRDEAFSYFDEQAIDRGLMERWWKADQPFIATFKSDEIIATTQLDGTVTVSYVVNKQPRILYCKMLYSTFRIVGFK